MALIIARITGQTFKLHRHLNWFSFKYKHFPAMQQNNKIYLVVSFVVYSGINKFNLKRSLMC